MPKIESCWLPKGKILEIPTLGYNKRINCFITLFWPRKDITWNCFPRRRNIEFRKHLSTVLAKANRRKLKKVILFVDHASYHETAEVKKFVREHPILEIKWLGKKDPNSNPTEGLVNKRLSAAVSVNRHYQGLEELQTQTKKFLRKYNSIYAT